MKIRSIVFAFCLLFALSAAAADKLAIAEPVAKSGVSKEEVDLLWNMLESSVDGGYELISRSALKQLLTEINLTDSSGLTELNSEQRAKLGELKTVRYLLISNLGKFGSRRNISLMVMDSSTGQILPDRKISETFTDMDELADKLDDILTRIGLGRPARNYGRNALLTPLIRTRSAAPDFLPVDFNNELESALLERGMKLQAFKSAAAILRKNNIPPLDEAEPALFARAGSLLRVDYLLQPIVTRFDIVEKREAIEVTRQVIIRRLGYLEGTLRILDARTGETFQVIKINKFVDFTDLNDTEDWMPVDFGKYLIREAVRELLPKIPKC